MSTKSNGSYCNIICLLINTTLSMKTKFTFLWLALAFGNTSVLRMLATFNMVVATAASPRKSCNFLLGFFILNYLACIFFAVKSMTFAIFKHCIICAFAFTRQDNTVFQRFGMADELLDISPLYCQSKSCLRFPQLTAFSMLCIA